MLAVIHMNITGNIHEGQQLNAQSKDRTDDVTSMQQECEGRLLPSHVLHDFAIAVTEAHTHNQRHANESFLKA